MPIYQISNLAPETDVPAINFPETNNYDSDYDSEYDNDDYDNIEPCDPMITDQELDSNREERYQQSLVSGKAVWMYAPHPINSNSKRWDMGTLDFSKATIDTPVVEEYNEFPKFSKNFLDRMVREKEELLTCYQSFKDADAKKIRDEATALKAHAKKMKDKIYERKKKAGKILDNQKAVAVKATEEEEVGLFLNSSSFVSHICFCFSVSGEKAYAHVDVTLNALSSPAVETANLQLNFKCSPGTSSEIRGRNRQNSI